MGGRGTGSEHSLVLIEMAGRGDPHKGPKDFECPGRDNDHMQHEDGEEIRTFKGEREELSPDLGRSCLYSRMRYNGQAFYLQILRRNSNNEHLNEVGNHPF